MLRSSSPRASPFSSNASVTRGFASTGTASESSTTPAIPRPLEAEDVEIELMVNGSSTSATGQSHLIGRSKARLVVERSFFVVPLNAEGKQMRRPNQTPRIGVDDIQVIVIASPEEGLLFGSSVLKSDEVELITTWLVKNYSLASLQRTSVQIFQDLEASHASNPRRAESLEQRALVVAEASGRRATQEADADSANSKGRLRRTTRGMPASTRYASGATRRSAEGSRQRKSTLLEEKQNIEDTLLQFNQKIAMFAMDDPATAEMLMPAKFDLEDKLRHLRAQLASLGATESEHSGDAKDEACVHKEEGRGDLHNKRSHEYATDAFDNDDISEESSEDNIDLRMALPIEGSEYDLPFIRSSSGRSGYISSSDGDLSPGNYLASTPTAVGAEYVIDLGQPERRHASATREQALDFALENVDRNVQLHENSLDDETFNICNSPVATSDFSPRICSGSTVDSSSDLEASAGAHVKRRGSGNNWYRADML